MAKLNLIRAMLIDYPDIEDARKNWANMHAASSEKEIKLELGKKLTPSMKSGWNHMSKEQKENFAQIKLNQSKYRDEFDLWMGVRNLLKNGAPLEL